MQDLCRTLSGVPSCALESSRAGWVQVAVLSSANKLRQTLIGICAPRDVCVSTPDTFDSTDPKRLRTFLVQCELCFQDQAKAFCLDRAKVTFAQSYLKGMMLQ